MPFYILFDVYIFIFKTSNSIRHAENANNCLFITEFQEAPEHLKCEFTSQISRASDSGSLEWVPGICPCNHPPGNVNTCGLRNVFWETLLSQIIAANFPELQSQRGWSQALMKNVSSQFWLFTYHCAPILLPACL